VQSCKLMCACSSLACSAFLWSAAWLLVGRASEAAEAAEKPPPEATVFYSKEDPHWAEAEKVLDGVVKQNPRLKLTKVCIDDDAGYWQLAELEQKMHINPPGELTLVIGEIALTSKEERRDVEKCFGGVVKRLRFPDDGKGRLEPDVSAFAREIFGKDATVDPSPDPKAEHSRYHPIGVGGKRAGWVVDAFRHITCPTCNDMQFLMAVSVPEAKVLQIRPQRDLERLAAKLDDQESSAFLAQFKGRTTAAAQQRVDAISGVTKTCHMYESCVREALAEIQRREKQ